MYTEELNVRSEIRNINERKEGRENSCNYLHTFFNSNSTTSTEADKSTSRRQAQAISNGGVVSAKLPHCGVIHTWSSRNESFMGLKVVTLSHGINSVLNPSTEFGAFPLLDINAGQTSWQRCIRYGSICIIWRNH